MSLEVFLSVGALGGGGALMFGPMGQIIPLPMSLLKGSPFDTWFAPGLILFCILGLGPLVAAALAWRRHPWAPLAASAVGLALLIWLAVEIAIIGYSNNPPLQPFYLLLALRSHRQQARFRDHERVLVFMKRVVEFVYRVFEFVYRVVVPVYQAASRCRVDGRTAMDRVTENGALHQ